MFKPAAARDATSTLSRYLGIVRWIWHLRPSVLSCAEVTDVAFEHLECQVKLGRCAVIELAPHVALPSKAVAHGNDREILGYHVIELLPGQRRGDLGVGCRPD